MTTRGILLLMVAMGSLGMRVAGAQTFPSQPVRIITAAAGGGSDFLSRVVAQGISGPLGQPVVVANYSAGVIPGMTVLKAPADGHTLLVSGPVLWVGSLLRPAPYDPIRDFAPITVLAAAPSVVVATLSLPATSIAELIALAKSRPGQINYASAGTGTQTHLAAELFKYMAGVRMQGIPYTNPGLRLSDILEGRTHIAFDDGLMPHVRSGKLKALAVTSLQRSALAPGLPTVAESGLPGYESILKTGFFARAETPDAAIRRLNSEVVRLLNLPETKAKLLEFGTEAVGGAPEDLALTLRLDRERYGKVIQAAGISVD